MTLSTFSNLFTPLSTFLFFHKLRLLTNLARDCLYCVDATSSEADTHAYECRGNRQAYIYAHTVVVTQPIAVWEACERGFPYVSVPSCRGNPCQMPITSRHCCHRRASGAGFIWTTDRTAYGNPLSEASQTAIAWERTTV